jgi:predicted nucleic acid-binding protein
VRQAVVADAGPLIALATTGHLSLLHGLFGHVLIPEAVRDELELSSHRPGAAALSRVLSPKGWLVVNSTRGKGLPTSALGMGESEAIEVAAREHAVLLIDDRRGRRAARGAGVSVIGTGRLLLAAKQKGLIKRVSPVLDQLADAGYRLSDALVERLKQRADEG